jgi:P4 family phage/plasmid primase-like protien
MTMTDETPADGGEVPAPVRDLMPGHARELAESEISDAVAAARGYRTLYGGEDDLVLLKDLKIPRWAWREEVAFPGILMPMYRVTGEEIGAQWKPAVPQETPNGKLQKYASQAGVPNRLDVPPTVSDAVRDPSVPLWITEGVKKADCLASLNKAVLTLTGVFNWRSKLGTLGDWEDIPLQGRVVVICFDSDANDKRNVLSAMQRLGRWLESKGSRVKYLIVPEAVNGTAVKGVDDFFHAGGTMDVLSSASMDALPVETKDATFTDSVLADSVHDDRLDGLYRYAGGLGWMHWTGKVWKGVSEVDVTEEVRLWALEKFHGTLDEQRSNSGRDLGAQIDGWRGVLNAGRLRAVVSLARGVTSTDPDAFDNNPDLINCQNGIVDLRTGVRTDHDPDMLMTKLADVDYVKGAQWDDWDKALTALPDDVVSWFQLRVGQAITGHMTPDDVVVICQGGGANGKSTVYDTLSLALGKYHVQVSDRVILGHASDNHPTEIMDLMGARYAVLEETPEARRLDTNRLKKLSGTREITGRRIRQDPVTFKATHSLFVNSNHKPVVDETDHGTWRRLALLRWPFTFRGPGEPLVGPDDREGDASLRERLKASPQAHEAAFAWLVAGAQRWYALGGVMPRPPERVRRDTDEWRMDADLILRFTRERLAVDKAAHVVSSELTEEFNNFLKDRNQAEWSGKTFVSRFGGHDYVSQAGITRKKIKARSGVSRPAGITRPLRVNYDAWLGVRFDTENGGTDGGTGADQEGPDPFKGPNQDQVPSVPSAPVNAIEIPTRGVYKPEGTGGTGDGTDQGNQDQTTPETVPEPAAVAEPAAPPSGTGKDAVITSHLPASATAAVDPFTDASAMGGGPSGAVHPDAVSDPFADWEVPDAPVDQDDTATPERPPLFTPGGSVGFDLETASAEELFLRPDFVRLSGAINADGETRTDLTQDEMVTVISEADHIYGHNILGYDGLALAHWHGLDWEAFADKAVDTELRARLLDPPHSRMHGSSDPYDLDSVAVKYGVAGKTDDLKSLKRKHGGYDKIPLDDPQYHAYLDGDLHATQAVAAVFPEMSDYEKREHRLAKIAGRMTLNGFQVNEPLMRQRIKEGQDTKAAALARLHDEYGIPLTKDVTRGRGKNKVTVTEPVKSPLATDVGKAALVKAIQELTGQPHYPRTETGELAAGQEGMAQLVRIFGSKPGITELADLVTTVTKVRTVYQTTANYLAADGRVHPTVSMRQSSGRWSVTGPGLTVFGKRDGRHHERDIFDETGSGLVIITCDLAQVDMRAIAGHCQDPAYMELFAPGRDAHTEIAGMLGIDRHSAKAMGHGWNYGLGATAMIERDGLDPDKVYAFTNGMEERFPRLCEWREQIRDRGGRGELLDNGFGRMMRCHPQSAYTVAPALMGQGGARDITMEVVLRLMDAHPEYAQHLRAYVHDEFVFAVPADQAEEIKAEVVKAFTWEWRGVPILADATGPCSNWGSASEK